MRSNFWAGFLQAVPLAVAVAAAPSGPARARATERVLHAFAWNTDGGFPYAGPTMDSKGNIYGVTYFGGFEGICCGTAYQLTPQQKGGWGYKIIHTFKGPDFDGEAPSGGLIADAAGNLYGTAQQGGKALFCGVVYELSPMQNGTWKESILHEFRHPGAPEDDGCTPSSYLVFDQAGNLYGTAQDGGGRNFNNECEQNYPGCGAVFKLAPQGGGKWKESVIFRFPAGKSSGIIPYSGLAVDHTGNLWGTTTASAGGTTLGSVFELTEQAGGKWKESAHFDFDGTDAGGAPYGSLVIDNAGNVYGTTYYGGQGAGVVFELTQAGHGQLNETIIHQFAPCGPTECPDGVTPFGGLTIDAAGNLYGTTPLGGAAGSFCNSNMIVVGCGVLFKLTPTGNGGFNYKILYAFPGAGNGAYLVDDRPLVAPNGDIFGTTLVGGDANEVCPQAVPGLSGCGTVFQVTP
jgi:hypothetical protein